MQYYGSLEAAEKHISAEIFKENLHTSVKVLQICMDLQDSVQRSLQNPAEKILQICTDSQRSKTWVLRRNYDTRFVIMLPHLSKLTIKHFPETQLKIRMEGNQKSKNYSKLVNISTKHLRKCYHLGNIMKTFRQNILVVRKIPNFT